jgi:hypothetical protein
MGGSPLALACACAFLLASASASALEVETILEIQGFYSFPNHEAVDAEGFAPIDYGGLQGASESGRDLGPSWGGAGAKVILARKLTFPALAGAGALTRDNNLSLTLSGELTPISFCIDFEASLTPVAFLKLSAGASGGTGWDIGFTGPGLGLVDPDSGNIEKQDFGGLVYRAWGKGTLQMDLAAILPGEWNHLVAQASPSLEYRAYTRAGAGRPWIWEADEGMNFNGWSLCGEYFIGYQMPIAFSLTGILVQTRSWLGYVREMAPSDGSKASCWGSDFTYITFGPVFGFALNARSGLTILPQFKTGIDWTDSTTLIKDFEKRVFSGPYLYFYRVAFDYSLKL